MKRRDFIKKSTFISAGTLMVPQFIKAATLNQLPQSGNKKIIIIQLSGGNDG